MYIGSIVFRESKEAITIVLIKTLLFFQYFSSSFHVTSRALFSFGRNEVCCVDKGFVVFLLNFLNTTA